MSKIKDGVLFFWYTKDIYSQWHPSEFIILDSDGLPVKYYNSEQYMMAQKALMFGDAEIHLQIMKERDPKKIKALGREIRNFNEFIWNNNVDRILFDANFAKFSQNKKFKAELLSTKDLILAEASPYDKLALP